MKKDLFVVFDGNALLHRSFHALPPLSTKKGEMVNAIYGFVSVLLKVLKDYKPQFVVVAFDRPEPTFRHDAYDGYKAQRERGPQALYDQLPRLKEVIKAFNIPTLELKGYEADDIIGTLCERAKTIPHLETIIVTGDMDTLQLVNEHTKVLTLKRGIGDTIVYDREEVKKKYDGLTPEQMVDYKALRGDPSDNIPGVRGIGEKTAQGLLNTYKTLDAVLNAAKKGTLEAPARVKELLSTYEEDAHMSKMLAQIHLSIPLSFDIKDGATGSYNIDTVYELFQELGFKSLLSKLPPREEEEKKEDNKKDTKGYHVIDTESELKKFLKQISTKKEFVFDTEGTSLNPRTNILLGMSFSFKEEEAYYVNTKDHPKWIQLFKSLLEGGAKKIAHNMKYDMQVMTCQGVDVKNIYFDTMIASYVLNSSSRAHDLDTLAFGEFGHQMIPLSSLVDLKKTDLRDAPLHDLGIYSCEDADYTYRLKEKFEKELDENNVRNLFRTIEMPMVEVLSRMELNGVMVDVKVLNEISKKITIDISKVEKKIHTIAGKEFNVSSPQQLQDILFNVLALPTEGLTRIKTGISTSAMELEKLQGLHPIIEYITEYRELVKLQSTYVDALPKLVDPITGRVHTSYNQTVAVTGRLSSADPNLQNIPIRTPLGRSIRKAFIVPKGYTLLSADYSQIELRVVASLSGDKEMTRIFNNGEDIHRTTASFIHDVPVEKITKDMRSSAKEVNFGVLYGMGVYGLSSRTGITREKAKEFIDRYYTAFEGVKKYLDDVLVITRALGYSETLFGRKRYIPEINSTLAQVRAAAERTAINMPVQGTAADLMKLGMITIHHELGKISPESKMLMQVHDELVFEVPNNDVERVAKFVKSAMEGVYKLRVPIEVGVKTGLNWEEMEDMDI